MNGGSENYCHEFRQSEPLSWDEQLTSYQVKLLKQSKPTTPLVNESCKKIFSQPVVFHHSKNSVEEILKKQKMHFHLNSCHLPKLQSVQKKDGKAINSKSRHSLYLSNGKHEQMTNVKKSTLLHHRLRLKGNQIKSANENYVNTNFYKGGRLFLNGSEDRIQSHSSSMAVSDLHSRSENGSNEEHVDTSVYQQCTHHEYVEIPVPKSALTDESCSIVSELKDLSGDGIAEISTPRRLTAASLDEHNVLNELDKFASRSDTNIRKSSTQEEINCGNNFGKRTFMDGENNTSSRCISSKSREDHDPQISSCLTYNPCSPPLFLREGTHELFKGASPSKVLLELRQTFCENMRKETEQLEFDLQELYLKKQLHKR